MGVLQTEAHADHLREVEHGYVVRFSRRGKLLLPRVEVRLAQGTGHDDGLCARLPGFCEDPGRPVEDYIFSRKDEACPAAVCFVGPRDWRSAQKSHESVHRLGKLVVGSARGPGGRTSRQP